MLIDRGESTVLVGDCLVVPFMVLLIIVVVSCSLSLVFSDSISFSSEAMLDSYAFYVKIPTLTTTSITMLIKNQRGTMPDKDFCKDSRDGRVPRFC